MTKQSKTSLKLDCCGLFPRNNAIYSDFTNNDTYLACKGHLAIRQYTPLVFQRV